MKLRQRYVIVLMLFVVAVMSLSLFLTFTHRHKLLTAVHALPAMLQQHLAMTELRPQPHKFVRQLTAEEFRHDPSYKTGNPLIDDYGNNNLLAPGERGSAVHIPDDMKDNMSAIMEKYRVDVMASDVIPLNRLVPDSRIPGLNCCLRCSSKRYAHDLPTASVIIPFHDEWYSVLLRTMYSVINRTPRHLLWEIVLVDDASTLERLKEELDTYITTNFPIGLVKMVRFKERVGLVRARMEGVRRATGQVIVIFDSHMEVNVQWLEPLLTQLKAEPTSIALGILDYIKPDSFLYGWHQGHLPRYGFDWTLMFFETPFRPDLYGEDSTIPKRGTVMVGTGFAVHRKYFLHVGGYDEGMDIWGGENLELSWRVWMCGGSLVHIPCSKVGHIARAQPYSFPGGRRQTELHNYKRAVDMWMEDNHKEIIHIFSPDMTDVHPGDLTERRKVKERLQCKNFTWYLDNIWPELAVFGRDAAAWGVVENPFAVSCLDDHGYLFTYPEPLFLENCRTNVKMLRQGFMLTKDGLFRSSLQCLVIKKDRDQSRVHLEDCITGQRDKWSHTKPNEHIRHERTGMCLDVCHNAPCVRPCSSDVATQFWTFTHYL